MKTRRAIVLCLLAAISAALPASASLVYYRNIDISGTGHGTVIQLLDFGNSPQPITVSGCASWNGSADEYGNCTFTDHGGSYGTTYTFGSDQISNPPTRTETVQLGTVPSMLGGTGISSPFDIGVVYNPAENSGLLITHMVLTFYAPTGNEIYSAFLESPYDIALGGTGSGGSGFTFGLDWVQAMQVQQLIAQQPGGLDISQVRIGLSATVANHDSHSYFFVQDIDNLALPEPATFVLLGSALIGLAVWRKRRA